MEYIIGIIIFGLIIGAIVYFVKKENEKLEQLKSQLTEEEKNKLSLTEVKFIEGKNNEWIQDGLIAEINEKKNKYAIKVLWYNSVIPNNFLNNIEYGDTTLSKDKVINNNLKKGDFVKVYIAPEKTIDGFKIILK